MKKKTCFGFFLLPGILWLSFCRKKFDNPPYIPVNDGAQLSIQQLKNRVPVSSSLYRFGTGDTNLYCTITVDQTSGNFFNVVYARDDQGGAIELNTINPPTLYVGDRIRINLNEIYIINAASMISLDSINADKSIVKLSSGNAVSPKSTTISDIIKYKFNTLDPLCLQSQLVEINGAEFQYNYRGVPFADAISKSSGNDTLTDCLGNKINVRSSGFSNFAGKLTPNGNGKMIAVVTQFGTIMQLNLRNYNEIQMNNTPCVGPPPTFSGTTFLYKDFNDGNLGVDGWTNVNAVGTVNWIVGTSTVSSNVSKTAMCSNLISSGNQPACETWLISRSIDLSASAAPGFSFTSANSFSGPQLQTLVSTNYTAGAPSTATWTPLNAGYGTSVFVGSGNLSLAAYKKNNVRVAFKYTGNLNSGARWQIDNIRVYDP